VTHARRAVRISICAAVLLLAGVPAQALAQTAPPAPQPAKAVVVVQQAPSPAQPAAPGKAQVIVQTPGPAAPAVPASSSAAQPKPELTLSVPATANLDANIVLRAVLVDANAKPVSGAALDFASTAKFLNTAGSVVFAHSVTDTQGTASVDWQPRSAGSLSLTASFAGDQHLGAVTATAVVQVGGDQPLYQQQAGVSVPGLNAAPRISTMVSLTPTVNPWPRLSGWPVVIVLLIVWSLYARVVLFMFTLARGHAPQQAQETRS
jgi:hypothetical protein